ncbi:(R)-limonene synthase 1, chloroplastic-like [Pistacia vera]|uniref:(R)-limonene synthase 1, chloroplastic-like n=1 Tax=Pistacia vera TaxID=55513 RepID=UPI001262D5F3|nr:(R)-limonene synthase 1, chloroplastic-like [Pistacia vera]
MAFCMKSTSIPSPTVFKYSTRLLVPRRATSRISVHKKFQCIAGSELSTSTVVRRSGNYHPSIWDEGYLLSLTSDYTGDAYRKQAERLKEEVRMIMMINEVTKPLVQLQLIDTVQRLGLSYQFDNEITSILHNIHNNSDDKLKKENLHAVSLEFRLLRQHAYYVSQGSEAVNFFLVYINWRKTMLYCAFQPNDMVYDILRHKDSKVVLNPYL